MDKKVERINPLRQSSKEKESSETANAYEEFGFGSTPIKAICQNKYNSVEVMADLNSRIVVPVRKDD